MSSNTASSNTSLSKEDVKTPRVAASPPQLSTRTARTGTMLAPGNASSAPTVVSTDVYGAVWQGIYNDLTAGNTPYWWQSSLQRATTTSNGFTLSSTGGAPAVVTNHLKLPTYQLVKSAPGVDDDPWVTEALKAANDSLTAVHDAATTLLSTRCADCFAADLTAYCQDVVRMSGFEDVNRYETAVPCSKLAIDFTAKLMKTSAQKEAKAVTLANARADAEMTDATKPVVDTIREEIKRQVAAQFPTLLDMLKKNMPAQPTASSSTLKKASSSSSTKKPEQKNKDPKPKPNTKPAHAAKASSSSSKAKSAGKCASRSSVKQEESIEQEKRKAKATEEALDSDSS
ncbi:hypothetical protein B0H13DRAFT_2450577 [Mycena leptocephala]|nr:hypothetical protein B0H13DRAFT_2450577 [Mycena leptocephala]